ncbi:helix-hairpin-helix domain-containing protein [Halorarum halophilum]|uniref:Helix-hairpin-helix domain-containing protein n=1 Tax=Halorarum halophilum TaxID=2743090 RepID=A0A7D5K8V7_9EURY|nr:helix-hairpin-helix domain-containing protein [Halobaculum halophilum]QLG28579.1 helix-hairpin-helix domain-containing protein [Halobaculum halophilum]
MVLLRKIKRLLGIGGSSEEDGAAGEASVTVERERGSGTEPDASSEAAVKGTDNVAADEGESDADDDDRATAIDEDEETVAAGTDATGSTESIVDEEEATEDAAARAEPAEAAGPESEDITTDVDDLEPAEEAEESEAEEEDEEDVDVDEEETAAAGTDATGSTESIVDEEEATEDAVTKAETSEAAGPESDDVTTDVDDLEPTEEAGESETEEGVPVKKIRGIGPAYADRLSDMGIDTVADLAAADPAEVAEGTNVSESRVSRWIDRAAEYEP